MFAIAQSVRPAFVLLGADLSNGLCRTEQAFKAAFEIAVEVEPVF
ncbi:hypothetical protein [Microbulbifer epialgicus]|uniref:Uncharacterized protein n=1 Tax=Microbulbifer epialgicus TaxID=393907 RepID=A0ABV4P224_9GAMM